MTTAPHGSSCAGFPFAPGVFRGLFVVCLICHFNAPVRRFNSGRYPILSLLCVRCTPCLRPYGVALSAAPLLAACAASSPPPFCPCALVGGWLLLGGAVSVAGGVGPSMLARDSGGGVPRCQSRYQSRRGSRKSRWHSRSLLCKSRYKSRQCLRQSRYESRSLYPKIIVVYKIPCIKAVFPLPPYHPFTESRSKVA